MSTTGHDSNHHASYLAYADRDWNVLELFVNSDQEARIHRRNKKVHHPVGLVQHD